MRESVEDVDLYDTLRTKDLPFLDDDESIRIRKYRDFLREGDAETHSTRWVKDDPEDEAEAEQSDDEDDGDGELPIQTGGRYIDQAKLALNRFHYMCLGWNLFNPPNAEGVRTEFEFTRQNRRKLMKKHGIVISAHLAIRGYGTAVQAKLEGKVDPDSGEALTFRKGTRVRATGRVREGDMAGDSAAGSVRTA